MSTHTEITSFFYPAKKNFFEIPCILIQPLNATTPSPSQHQRLYRVQLHITQNLSDINGYVGYTP